MSDGATQILADVDGLVQRGLGEEAAALLERAIESLPSVRVLADRLIGLYISVGRISNALEIAWADIARNGVDARRASLMAHLALQSGDIDRALVAARQSVAADPTSAADHAMLASLAFRRGLLEEAERAARAAVDLEPDRLDHRRLLAAVLTRLDRTDDVVAALADLVAAAPNDPGLRRELSAAYGAAGRLVEAEREARAALALAPTSLDARLHLSGLSAQLGHADEAIELLREVIRQRDDHAVAHHSLSHLLWAKGEFELAIVHARRAVTLDPEAGYRDHYLALLELRMMAPADPTTGGNSRPATGHFARLGDPAERRRGPLAERARVVFALMLREMQTRHANTRLGFAWSILEPLAHLAVLAVVFTIFNRGRPPLGVHWFFFYATGVIPFLMFSHIATHGFHGLVANVYVLHVPAIRRTDLLLASALVELVIAVTVGAMMFFAFWATGSGPAPANPIAVIASVAVLWLFAFSISLLNATIETVNGLWLRVWPSITRILYFTSGIFYVPQEMPEWLRSILVLNPLLLCIDWFRTGFFVLYDPPWLDRVYVVVVTLLVVLLGLMFEVALRRRAVRL